MRADNHQSAANANQGFKQKRAWNRQFQARSAISGDLSKPPPSASRPPHRGLSSIRDSDSYAEALDSEAWGAIRIQTAACGAKYWQQEWVATLSWRIAWAHRSGHTFGHTRYCLSRRPSKTGRKTTKGDGFSDRRLRPSVLAAAAAQRAR